MVLGRAVGALNAAAVGDQILLDKIQAQTAAVRAGHIKFEEEQAAAPKVEAAAGPKKMAAAANLMAAAPGESKLLSTPLWANSYLSFATATTVHVDTNVLSAQLYFGRFERRLVVLPTLCMGFYVKPRSVVCLESSIVPHSSLRDAPGHGFMLAAYNSKV